MDEFRNSNFSQQTANTSFPIAEIYSYRSTLWKSSTMHSHATYANDISCGQLHIHIEYLI